MSLMIGLPSHMAERSFSPSLPLTPANFRAKRITVTPFIRELPKDAIGGSTDDELGDKLLTLRWKGFEVQTDIPTEKGNRERLRGFLRHRGELNNDLLSVAEIGDVVLFEQLGTHDFLLHIEKPDGTRILGASTSDEREERERKWVQRAARPDQRKFRQGIIDRDGLKCAISGCGIPEVLDAAHLHGHADNGSSDPSNGIILRKDLHNLFDADLLHLGLDGKVTLDARVTDPDYTRYEGMVLSSTADLQNLQNRSAA
ncbi:HNH endonuclease signature motif containing protein [Paracoccus sulfuroxidans]|nr:HNH endonuclease signature motif containing protein [Paracoccus sulfuroxidans]